MENMKKEDVTLFIRQNKELFTEKELNDLFTIYKIPAQKKKLTYKGIIFTFLLGVSSIILGAISQKIFLMLMGAVMSVPIFLFGVFLLIIRLFLDKDKIKNKIRILLPGEFIIANFLEESKRITKEVIKISDGANLYSNDGGLYLVDSECIIYDDSNYPNVFYIRNLPLPLQITHKEITKNIIEQIKEGNVKDSDLVHYTLSARNMIEFKKNKFF